MNRRRLFLVFAMVSGASVVTLAQHHEDGESVKEVYTQNMKEKLNGKDAAFTVVEVTIEPGKQGLPHRHPGPGLVYVAEGEYECGAAPDGSPMSGRFTAVWVKQDGRWLLDSLRESVVAGPQVDKHLRPLEWLLGEWVAESDGAAMLVSAR